MLVDCGRGVTQRALEAGLDLSAVVAVCLTHHHSDHLSDLATLAITRFVGGATTDLRVVAPLGPCSRFAETCLAGYEDHAFYSQRTAGIAERPLVEVQAHPATSTPAPVLDDRRWRVLSAAVDHHPIEAAVGYRIECDGLVVAVSGDTVVCDGIRRLATDADALVHQALRSDLVSADALSWNASARSVGELAAATRVEQLALTHLIPSPANQDEADRFADEAREGGFTGPITTPSDLDRLRIGPTD